MKVLVTGGKGFIGSWLVPGLIEKGHDIDTYDAVDSQDIFNIGELVAAMKGHEAIVHLVAHPTYKPDIAPAEYVRLNIVGVAKAIEAMKIAKVKSLVYVSSGAVYGFGPGRPHGGWVTPPISEKQTQTQIQWGLLDIYSATKLACAA